MVGVLADLGLLRSRLLDRVCRLPARTAHSALKECSMITAILIIIFLAWALYHDYKERIRRKAAFKQWQEDMAWERENQDWLNGPYP
jgi:hypothetical protein